MKSIYHGIIPLKASLRKGNNSYRLVFGNHHFLSTVDGRTTSQVIQTSVNTSQFKNDIIVLQNNSFYYQQNHANNNTDIVSFFTPSCELKLPNNIRSSQFTTLIVRYIKITPRIVMRLFEEDVIYPRNIINQPIWVVLSQQASNFPWRKLLKSI